MDPQIFNVILQYCTCSVNIQYCTQLTYNYVCFICNPVREYCKTLGDWRFGCFKCFKCLRHLIKHGHIMDEIVYSLSNSCSFQYHINVLLTLIHRYRRRQTVRARGQCGWRHWVQRVGYRSFLCLIKTVGSLDMYICAFFVAYMDMYISLILF